MNKEEITQLSPANGQLVAVYGTLRRGQGNHRLLENEFSEYLGQEWTPPTFKMVSLGGFPGLIPAGEQSVLIEVYRITSKDVERSLDRLEGYPNFYQKMDVKTQWGTAIVYILSEERYGTLPVVSSGDWMEERKAINKKY